MRNQLGSPRTHCLVIPPITFVEVAARLIKSQQLKHSHLQSDRHVGQHRHRAAASMRAALYDNQITVHLDINERAQTVAPELRHASRRAAGPSGTERTKTLGP